MPSLQPRACSIEGCTDPVNSRGWCLHHYEHYRRHGTPQRPTPEDLPNERWATIPGYDGYYEVSDLGRIRSLDRVIATSNGRLQKLSGRLMSLRSSQRYEDVLLAKDGATKRVKVHVAVARAFLGAPPPSHEVNHKNRDRRDNRLVNLEYVTRLQNLRHAQINGGVRGVTKLTPDDVRAVRRLRAKGLTAKQIGARFGVGPGCVLSIMNGKTWGYVK